MSATLTPVEPSSITTGNQLFRCVPYNCTMLARSCVERQGKAELGLDALMLLKCKGCELGAVVKSGATDVTFTERELLKGARGARHHRGGELGKKLRGAPVNPNPDAAPEPKLTPRRALPIIGLELAAPAAPAPSWKPWSNRVLGVFAAAPSPFVVACARCRTEFATDKALGAHHVHCSAAKPKNEDPMPQNIDLEGKELAGVKVLHMAPKEPGQKGAAWRVRFKACGHEDTVIGFVLTSAEKKGAERKCKECSAVKSDGGAKPSKLHAAAEAPGAKEPKPARRKGTQERPAQLVRAELGTNESNSYEFPLRRDFRVTVTLPADLRSSDVQRLTRWLDTFAFDDPSPIDQ